MRTSISCLSTALVLACPLAVGCYGPADAGNDHDAGASTGEAQESEGSDDASSTTPEPGDDDGNEDSSDDGADAGEDPDTTAGDTGEVVDTTPPTLVSSVPADGDVGIYADTQIRLVFSEPMDKASVQVAYQSADLPEFFVTMAWNDDGDELVITPAGLLEYGAASSPAEVIPRVYTLTITTAATDVAGNELEQDATVAFTTLKAIVHDLPIVAALTGAVRQDGDAYPGFIMAGDAALPANARWKGFVSFGLDDLPDDIAMFVAAELAYEQLDVIGSPYDDLGSLEIHDVVFGATDLTAFEAASTGPVGISDEVGLGQDTFDVTPALQADLAAGADLTQFRFEFPVASDFDDAYDYALFSATDPGPVLRVGYLIP